MQLILKNFPLGPSSNSIYACVNGRFIKSLEARKYSASVDIYKLRKYHAIQNFISQISNDDIFQIDTHFVFQKNRILNKSKNSKSKYKKLDTANRLKSALDGLSKILDIDDSRFFSGIYTKNYCENQADEQVIIVITKTCILSLEELIKKLEQK
jgi:Holliday junction resolvase RusA-like endonuclease